MNLGTALLITVSASLTVFAADNDNANKPKPAPGEADKAPASAPGAPADKAPAEKLPEDKAPANPNDPVPLKFVPAKKGEGKGASGTALSRKSFDPGARTAMIHIGVGDSFPVMDEKGTKLFTLHMTDGDDKHLNFEVRSTDPKTKDAKKKEIVQKVAVVRDEVSDVTVNGENYELRFPTTRVNAADKDKAITHEAMVFVAHRS